MHYVAVAAGKGGVGKSTIAVQLGAALVQKGYQVGILDADLYGPSLKQMVREESMPFWKEGRLYPARGGGMELISYSYFQQAGGAVRAPVANGIIEQFVKEVVWGNLDYLIVDFPPGTGDIPLTLTQEIGFDGVLIAATPQEVALIDIRKTIEMFQRASVPIWGVVENMSFIELPNRSFFYPFGQGRVELLAREYGLSLLQILPLDPLLAQASDEGKSIFSFGVDLEMSKRFLHLASLVENQNKGREKILFSQRTKDSFTIEWPDGTMTSFHASDIQGLCPCVRCREKPAVAEKVEIEELAVVGRYGVRFRFNQGCSQGIYPFELLKRSILVDPKTT